LVKLAVDIMEDRELSFFHATPWLVSPITEDKNGHERVDFLVEVLDDWIETGVVLNLEKSMNRT
jgi:hypothetical protein